MTALHRRLRAIERRVAPATRAKPEEPGSVQWLGVLRAVLPALERAGPAAEAACRRVRESIALLEGYVAAELRKNPWAYLED
jgi:hypothetical protein